MNTITQWRAAPPAVKWTSLLWFVLGITALVPGLYHLILFLRSLMGGDVWASDMVILGIAAMVLGNSFAGLTVLAAWRFLEHASWGRATLEILSWLNLVYFAVFGIFWIGSAVRSWDEFKMEATTELPSLSAELVFAIGVLITVLLVWICAIVIRTIRSAAARKYVMVTKGK